MRPAMLLHVPKPTWIKRAYDQHVSALPYIAANAWRSICDYAVRHSHVCRQIFSDEILGVCR
jgi:hypothetical protein